MECSTSALLSNIWQIKNNVFFNLDKVTKHVLDNLKNSINIKQNIFLQILPTQFTIHTVHISQIIRLSATQNQNENIL